jgi:hypothetical protein
MSGAPPTAIPELGPLLGRLAGRWPAPPGGDAGLEAVRLALVSALFDRAGAARARLAAGDPAAAADALGPTVWLEAWERAVGAASGAVVGEIVRRLREAAAASRFSAARLSASLPREEDKRILEARLSAAGIGFEEAVTGLTAGRLPWEEALRHAAGELESAWERLEIAAHRELAVWDTRAAAIREWRRPWTPLIIAAAALLTVAGWLGLVLGGYLPAPGWFRPVAEWVWNLPWP